MPKSPEQFSYDKSYENKEAKERLEKLKVDSLLIRKFNMWGGQPKQISSEFSLLDKEGNLQKNQTILLI